MRALEPLAPREMVVKKEAEPQHPHGAQALLMRQNEFQRPDDMRRGGEQQLALGQRLVHEAKFVEFQITQAAVDELGRGGGCAAGEIVLLDESNRQGRARRVARNGAAIDAAADDEKIEDHARAASQANA